MQNKNENKLDQLINFVTQVTNMNSPVSVHPSQKKQFVDDKESVTVG